MEVRDELIQSRRPHSSKRWNSRLEPHLSDMPHRATQSGQFQPLLAVNRAGKQVALDDFLRLGHGAKPKEAAPTVQGTTSSECIATLILGVISPYRSLTWASPVPGSRRV